MMKYKEYLEPDDDRDFDEPDPRIVRMIEELAEMIQDSRSQAVRLNRAIRSSDMFGRSEVHVMDQIESLLSKVEHEELPKLIMWD